MPHGKLRGAVEIEELHYFEPSLSGPAANQTPFTGDEDEHKAADADGENLSEADTAKTKTVLGAAGQQMHELQTKIRMASMHLQMMMHLQALMHLRMVMRMASTHLQMLMSH